MKKSVLIALFIVFSAFALLAQSTDLTYQGQLQSSSAAANGNFDFEFLLFDSGGSQIGPTLTRNGVLVANGIFSVNLDFGSSFPGASRFLEIRVRPAGGGAFTTLSPRQPVNSAPYSIKSLTANSADNATNAVNATNATNATTAATATNALSLGGVAANQYLQTNGNGSGVTSLNAGNISSGTLSNARLGQIPSANIADNAVTAAKIANAQVVKGMTAGATTLTDNVTLAAGANITITPAGNTVTIASTGGGGGVGGSGATNTIPLWSAGTTLSNSLISQAGGTVQLPGFVSLAATASGNNVSFGTPNSETGMTISGANGRADLRFDGSTLKLVAGPPASGPPAATNGVAIDTGGNVGIGSAAGSTARLSVAGGAFQDGLSVFSNSNVGITVSSGTGTALVAVAGLSTAYAARLLGKVAVAANLEILQPGSGIVLRSPNGNACRLLSINNAGTLISTEITCPF